MKSSDEETRYIINCDIFSYWWCRPDLVTEANSIGKYFPNKFLQCADLISDWKEETGRCLACGRKVSPDMILFSVSWVKYRVVHSWSEIIMLMRHKAPKFHCQDNVLPFIFITQESWRHFGHRPNQSLELFNKFHCFTF